MPVFWPAISWIITPGQKTPSASLTPFVDGLDLAAAGSTRVKPKMTGRPGYAPKDLLKLCNYLYGVFPVNRILLLGLK